MDTKELKFFYNKFKYGEDCYHNLMTNKVQNILLVSSFYDAFTFEMDGRLSEQIFGEYRELNLSMAPKITSVPSGEQALEILEEEEFDLVITMLHIGKTTAFELATSIKEKQIDLPIVLLLSMLSDEKYLKGKKETLLFDNIFVWGGDSKLFLAIIKAIEDKQNVAHDTEVGLVRVILMVEDSVKYYSMFLPLLYQEIVKQTQYLIESEVTDITKRLRMRARPKVLIAHDYNEAAKILEEYKEYIIAVISDTRYNKNDRIDPEAGVKLISKVKQTAFDIPTILLSSEKSNQLKADEINSIFLYKYSKNLLKKLKKFIIQHLGFGEFIFRNPDNSEITRATSLGEFKEKLKDIDNQSILYHSQNNHFSAWLMARGEIEMARKLKPLQINDFASIAELRTYLITMIIDIQNKKGRGKIINFYRYCKLEPNEITRMYDGSFGGKGRGLAFLNALLVAMEFDKDFPDTRIYIPSTAIIGTNEFDRFLEINKIDEEKLYEMSDMEIDEYFLSCNLSDSLLENLDILLEDVRYPIAIRSSALLEDSYAEPFAGIYRTFMLPNNHPDKNIRMKQLCDAIKLVIASVYNSQAREYIENMAHQLDEEKMAVIIQEIVGDYFGEDHFYPHFSGVAQSHNFYPISNLSNEDGIVSLAVGLGKSVVEGERIFRFCPKYPKKQFLTPESQLKNSQNTFYALNLKENEFNLLNGEKTTLDKLDISEAEKHGSITQTASTWDYQNNRIYPGIRKKGPRIINFDNILKYKYIPLAEIISKMLVIAETALGMPVEMEFAVNLTKNPVPTFYVLQVRPLTINSEEVFIPENINRDKLLLQTFNSMGNGSTENLTDIIFVNPDKFDKVKTEQMKIEVRQLNKQMEKEDKQYILIGPGRWGSQDRFLGIPVCFNDISHAKIIVEAGLNNFNIDPSQGTHFFHNVVAMELGYFTIPYNSSSDFIDWEWINSLEIIAKTEFLIHVKSPNPMKIKMDGKSGNAVIYK